MSAKDSFEHQVEGSDLMIQLYSYDLPREGCGLIRVKITTPQPGPSNPAPLKIEQIQNSFGGFLLKSAKT